VTSSVTVTELANASGPAAGVIPMLITAALADVVPPRLSVTLKLNEPLVVLLALGTKVRRPAEMSLAEMTWFKATAVLLSNNVPSVGSEVMVTLPIGSVVLSAESEYLKSKSWKV